MSDWDLMMPGMGLTAIGLAGVVVSYAGIAKTFIDGMHALTGLTMFVGLIFLACGILNGGVSTSNRAKATTLVIFGIAGSFGAFAFALTSVTTLSTFAGVLLIIIIPTIVISYAAMKVPQYAKPISVIFILAAGVGIASFVTLGFVGPGAQFSLQPPVMEEAEKPMEEPIPVTANIVSVEILAGASIPDSPDYSPEPVTVTKGDVIEWTNNDNVMHTVTSLADAGTTFDSSVISAGTKWDLDTKDLAAGEYEYFCTVHPFMTSKIIISEPAEPVVAKVSIPSGAMTQSEGQLYYDPQDIVISSGTTVVWSNDDTAAHTVTSGNPTDGASGMFDSSILPAGQTFEHKFDIPGKTEYYCQVHPWMVGTVTVE
ncbi:MAG TPA: plastocyanin/azurin family copper-binding protein [Nitrosopumilaceae archaeon]|nr:plastocyanin/azurin family copper-binding protein [Nitrosopumilaceae archaeon]